MTHPISGDLTLGHVMSAAGLDPSDVLLVRHTFRNDPAGTPLDAYPAEEVLAYTRSQDLVNKVGVNPPRLWLVFIADGGLRSRFYAAYENHGEVEAERSESARFFDLRPAPVMTGLAKRLTIRWSADAVNWAKRGERGTAFPVLEIADRDRVRFPGWADVLISHDQLKQVVDPDNAAYGEWRAALRVLRGIYLITDTRSGKLYVGKADGDQTILQRWSSYAQNGHGGNVGLQEVLKGESDSVTHFRYSILRVFSPDVTPEEVNKAESHYKAVLRSRDPKHGYNRN